MALVSFRLRQWSWASLLLIIALIIALPIAKASTLVESQNFTGASGSAIGNWKIQGAGASFITHTQSDSTSGKVVQLTPNANNSSGLLVYDQAFSTSLGVQVDFDYYMADGSGADGIAFFLVDGSTTNVTTGHLGGALGYGSDYSTISGVPHGYIAVGFDQYGNTPVMNGNSAGTGTNNGTPASNNVALLGSGNGIVGYRYLNGVTFGSMSGGWRRVSILTRRGTGSNGCVQDAICLTTKVSTNNGSTYTTVYNSFRIDNLNGQTAIPATFKLGFSASTGGLTNTHLIDNVDVYYDLAGADIAITKTGNGTGTVTATSNPTQSTQINCGSTCTVAYPTNAVVTLTTSPGAGSVFAGWSGACSGSGDYNVTVTTATACTAQFVIGKTVTASAGANGSVSPASALIVPGTSTSFTITPDSLYAIESVSGCDGSLSGTTYTTGAVNADCAVAVTFRTAHNTSIKAKGGVASTGLFSFLILLSVFLIKSGRRLLVLLPLIFLLRVPEAQALDGFYTTGSLGLSYTQVENSQVNRDMTERGINGEASIGSRFRMGWRFLGGYSITPHLALEGGYTQLGRLETEFNNTGTFDTSRISEFVPLSGAGWEATAVGRLPLNENWQLIGRLGAWWWSSKYDVAEGNGGSETVSVNGSGLVLGLGSEKSFSQIYPGLKMRLEVDRYELPRYPTYVGFVSVIYEFSGGSIATGSAPAQDPAPVPAPAPAPAP